MLKEFKIDLNDGDINPGSTVEGKLIVNVDRPAKYKSIVVTLRGTAAVVISQVRSNFQEFKWITYVEENDTVWITGDSATGMLPSGEHAFPFRFQLPHTIPSSFQGPYRGAVYTVSAIIKRRWFELNHIIETQLNVKESKDLFSLLAKPQSATMVKNVKFGSQSVSASVSIPRSGFSTGERIMITARITNETTNNVRIYSILIKQDVFAAVDTTTRLSITESKSAKSLGPEIYPGEDKTVQFTLYIPQVLSTIRNTFPNYRLEYELLVGMRIPWHGDKCVRMPLFITSRDPVTESPGSLTIQHMLQGGGLYFQNSQPSDEASAVQQKPPTIAEAVRLLTPSTEINSPPSP